MAEVLLGETPAEETGGAGSVAPDPEASSIATGPPRATFLPAKAVLVVVAVVLLGGFLITRLVSPVPVTGVPPAAGNGAPIVIGSTPQALPSASAGTSHAAATAVEILTAVPLVDAAARPIAQITALDCGVIDGVVTYEDQPMQNFLIDGEYIPEGGSPRPLPNDLSFNGPTFTLGFPVRPPPGRSEVRITARRSDLGASLPARAFVTC